MNLITNGEFAGNLDSWTLSSGAVYRPDEGYGMLGAAHLPANADYVSQSFTVPIGREHMVDVWAKKLLGGGKIDVEIHNADGDVVYQKIEAAVSAEWTNIMGVRVGLPAGSYTLTLTCSDTECCVDDVSIAWVIKSRLELADETAALLGDLATVDAGFSTTASGDNSEGDYTQAVDSGLRQVNAVDNTGAPDVRLLDEDSVDACIDEIQRYMLHKLHRYYALHATDFTLEGRTEHLHQKVNAIENLLGLSVGGRPSASGRSVKMGTLTHRSSLG